MKKEEIERLENIRFQLQNELTEIISKPISNESIREAKTIGSKIIGDIIGNEIMLDILNWEDDSKLSETALKSKYKNKDEDNDE